MVGIPAGEHSIHFIQVGMSSRESKPERTCHKESTSSHREQPLPLSATPPIGHYSIYTSCSSWQCSCTTAPVIIYSCCCLQPPNSCALWHLVLLIEEALNLIPSHHDDGRGKCKSVRVQGGPSERQSDSTREVVLKFHFNRIDIGNELEQRSMLELEQK